MRARLAGMFVAGCVVFAVAGPTGVGATGPSGQPISGAERISRGVANSLNWSGYAVYQSGTSFSDVRADWAQPTVAPGACPKKKTQLAAFFVGIDGYNSSSVEQTGTEADCVNGNPIYYAWYEMYPAPPVTLACVVNAGDAIHAEVKYNSGSSFTLTLKVNGVDCGPGTVSAAGTPARSSAELIAEAPATGGHFWPLTNFQNVTYSNASVTGGVTTDVINSSSWANDSITMVDRGRPANPTVKAAPGALNATGDGFTIAWANN